MEAPARRFSKRMGVSPMRYLASVRLAAAGALFEAGQRDVARVAEAVGYASDKAFARAFERWSGQTPAQYLQARANGPGRPA